MAAWPSSLPRFLADNYREAPKSQTIESSMDVGPPKSRRRSTASYRNIQVEMVVTVAQLATFEDFFETAAPDSVPFTIEQPRTGSEVSCRIIGDPPYTLEPVGDGTIEWQLSLQLQTSL